MYLSNWTHCEEAAKYPVCIHIHLDIIFGAVSSKLFLGTVLLDQLNENSIILFLRCKKKTKTKSLLYHNIARRYCYMPSLLSKTETSSVLNLSASFNECAKSVLWTYQLFIFNTTEEAMRAWNQAPRAAVPQCSLHKQLHYWK